MEYADAEIFVVVPSVGALLAAGARCADSLSARVAAAPSVSLPGDCRARRAGVGQSRDPASSAAVECAVSGVAIEILPST